MSETDTSALAAGAVLILVGGSALLNWPRVPGWRRTSDIGRHRLGIVLVAFGVGMGFVVGADLAPERASNYVAAFAVPLWVGALCVAAWTVLRREW